MPDVIQSVLIRLGVDKAAARELQQTTSATRQQYEAMVKTGAKLQSTFRTQGAEANRLYAQLANLNDAYREGRVDQARYQQESARLSAALKQADNAFGQTTQEIRETDNAIKTFYKDMKAGAAAQTAVDPNKAMRAQLATLRRTSAGVRGVGAGASLLFGAGVLPVTGAAGGITRAVYGIQALNYEFPNLTKSLLGSKENMIALTAATVAGATAFLVARDAVNKWKDSANEIKKVINGQIGALQDYYDFAGKATTQEVIDKQKELNIRQKTNVQMLQDLQDLKYAVQKGLVTEQGDITGQLASGAVRALSALGALDMGVKDLDKAIRETQTNIQRDKVMFGLLEEALNNAAFAANDAAQAYEKMRADQVDYYTKETEYFISSTRMSAENIKDRMDQIRTEESYYQSLKGTLEIMAPTSQSAQTALDGVNQKLADLANEAGVLQTVLPQAMAGMYAQNIADFFRQGLGKVSESLTSVGEVAAESAAKLDDYKQHMAEVEQDRLIQVVREEQDAALQRTRAIADHYRALARMDEQYYAQRQALEKQLAEVDTETQEKINDEREKYYKDAQKAARDHAWRLTQIQRDANDSIAEAAAGLDAVGVLQAQKQAKRELDDEKHRYDEEKKERDDDYQDRLKTIKKTSQADKDAARQALRDLDEQHRKERDENIRAFNEQLRREDEDRRIRRQRQEQDWALQDQRYRQHNQIIETTNTQHYRTMQGQTITGMANVRAAFGTGLSNLVTETQNVLNSATATASPTPRPQVSGGRYVPTYGSGGYPPLDRDVWVGDRGRELVRFMQPARIYAHGQEPRGNVGPVTVNIHEAHNPKATEQAVLNALGKVIP